eukprot:TRINITY_DN9470_c0_g4_i1.p2 TRINITY_DN9470_c0_g4~~TRINITY_DN9470_c0_g4_i1.p2  ORF type:complete len:150 (+),score=14.52 TRINITY_DN9470_c0_g4_i1:854-1303(+)
MSITTLVLNCIWNYVVFIWQLLIDVQGFDMNIPLVLSTMAVFFYVNIFQMQMFINIWRSRVSGADMSDNTPLSLLKFNFKIYFVILLGAFLVINLMTSPNLLLFILSFLWLPQILKNMFYSHNGSPSTFYIIAITCQHLYIPVCFLSSR